RSRSQKQALERRLPRWHGGGKAPEAAANRHLPPRYGQAIFAVDDVAGFADVLERKGQARDVAADQYEGSPLEGRHVLNRIRAPQIVLAAPISDRQANGIRFGVSVAVESQ